MQLRPFFWLALAGLFAALFAAAPARATGAVVGQPLNVCVAEARSGMTAARVLADQTGFDCTTPQSQFGPGDYWAVAAVPATVAGGAPLGVRIANLWQRSITFYALYADGHIVSRRIDDADASRHIQLGGILEQRLLYNHAAPIRLAWHVEGSGNMRGILLSPRIASPAESAKANLTMSALYASFAGLALALLVHNLAMWRALRQRFQLWYIVMLIGILLYIFGTSGGLAWVWPDLPNTGRKRLNYFAVALTGVAILGFARSFFEPRVTAGWLGRLTTGASVAVIITAALFVLAAPWRMELLDAFNSAAFLSLLVTVALIMWRAWRLGSPHVRPFALAWCIPLGLTVTRFADDLGLGGWSVLLDNSPLIAMAIEALGSSLIIAYRARLLAGERDAARAEELAARLLADTDPLTGLLNRRAFLNQAIGRTGEQTLLILDLDRFKSVNDTIGHDGGDEVLRRVAKLLLAACPGEGLATRLGGEEFALLCPAGQGIAADTLLERLRETPMPFDLTVTASVGGCTGPLATDKDWKALYLAADRALYMAKDGGRDRARVVGVLRPVNA